MLAGIIHGCKTGQPQSSPAPENPPQLPTRIDRLIAAYPELRDGKFAVIADFEDANQMQIVHPAHSSADAQLKLDPTGGRAETGAAALSFTPTSDADAIVFDNERAADWFLKRDWRGYDLLMFAVNAPNPGMRVDVAVSAGAGRGRKTATTSVPLARGWGVARVDVPALGERIALDDVREVRLSFSGASGAGPAVVDDLVLVSDRGDLFGDSANTDGRLYVQRAGDRVRVGSGGSFEVAFAGGHVVEWFNLASDSARLHNLVRGTVLGPIPVADAETAELDRESIMQRMRARQEVVEMNDVRVVVTTQAGPFADSMTPADRPNSRCTYHIYRTGHVFVVVDRGAADGEGPIQRLAFAFSPAAEHDVLVPKRTASNADGATFAGATDRTTDSSLLIVPGPGQPVAVVANVASGAAGRIVFTAPRSRGDAPMSADWHAMVYLSSEALSADRAATIAQTYGHPPEPAVELGTITRHTGDAPEAEPPIDLRTGAHRITPDRGRIRAVFDKRWSGSPPVIEVVESAGVDAWIYHNHVLQNSVARTATGNLLFQPAQLASRENIIEVLVRNSRAFSGS